MMNETAVFRSFQSPADAEPVLRLLKEAGIFFTIENNQPLLPSFMLGQQTERNLDIFISTADFLRAGEVLEKNALQMYQDVPEDYYLYQFSDAELRDVAYQKDEWNEFDRALAEQLLLKRGKGLSDTEKEAIHTLHIKKLSTPKSNAAVTFISGYLLLALSLFSISFFTAAGLGIGYHLYFHYRRLPDGTKVYVYDARSRLHGGIILWGGLAFLLLLLFAGIRTSWFIFELNWGW